MLDLIKMLNTFHHIDDQTSTILHKQIEIQLNASDATDTANRAPVGSGYHRSNHDVQTIMETVGQTSCSGGFTYPVFSHNHQIQAQPQIMLGQVPITTPILVSPPTIHRHGCDSKRPFELSSIPFSLGSNGLNTECIYYGSPQPSLWKVCSLGTATHPSHNGNYSGLVNPVSLIASAKSTAPLLADRSASMDRQAYCPNPISSMCHNSSLTKNPKAALCQSEIPIPKFRPMPTSPFNHNHLNSTQDELHPLPESQDFSPRHNNTYNQRILGDEDAKFEISQNLDDKVINGPGSPEDSSSNGSSGSLSRGMRYFSLETGGTFKNSFDSIVEALKYVKRFFPCPGGGEWKRKQQYPQHIYHCSCQSPSFTNNSATPILLKLAENVDGCHVIQLPETDTSSHAYLSWKRLQTTTDDGSHETIYGVPNPRENDAYRHEPNGPDDNLHKAHASNKKKNDRRKCKRKLDEQNIHARPLSEFSGLLAHRAGKSIDDLFAKFQDGTLLTDKYLKENGGGGFEAFVTEGLGIAWDNRSDEFYVSFDKETYRRAGYDFADLSDDDKKKAGHSTMFLSASHLWTLYTWFFRTKKPGARSISLDGIFGLIMDPDCPLITIGVLDVDLRVGNSDPKVTRSMRPVTHVLSRAEAGLVVSLALAALDRISNKIFGKPFIFGSAISDAAKGLIAGVKKYKEYMISQDSELDFTHHTCFVHIYRGLRDMKLYNSKVRYAVNIPNIKRMVYLLYRCSTKKQSIRAFELFCAVLDLMWESKFKEYFMTQYGPHSPHGGNWFYASCEAVGLLPNSQPVESYYKQISGDKKRNIPPKVPHNVSLDDFFKKTVPNLLKYDTDNATGYCGGMSSREMPERVPSFTAIALAAMMSYENDIVSGKSLGTDDSQVWYGNGPSALGASLTKERIERFHSAREGRTHGLQSDKHRPIKLDKIHLAMEEMEQLIFDTDTICRVTRYDLDDQQRPGLLYHGSSPKEVPFSPGETSHCGFACTCILFRYGLVCHTALRVAENLKQLGQADSIPGLCSTVFCRRTSKTSNDIKGRDTMKDGNLYTRSRSSGGKGQTNRKCLYASLGFADADMPDEFLYLQRLTNPQLEYLCRVRGIDCKKITLKQDFIGSIIAGTELGEQLKRLVVTNETAWTKKHEDLKNNGRLLARSLEEFVPCDKDTLTKKLESSCLTRLYDHDILLESKKEEQLARKKRKIGTSPNSDKATPNTRTKVTRQTSTEQSWQGITGNGKTDNPSMDNFQENDANAVSYHPSTEVLDDRQLDQGATKVSTSKERLDKPLPRQFNPVATHNYLKEYICGEYGKERRVYAIGTYQGHPSYPETTNACVALSTAISLYFLAEHKKYDVCTYDGLLRLINGGLTEKIKECRRDDPPSTTEFIVDETALTVIKSEFPFANSWNYFVAEPQKLYDLGLLQGMNGMGQFRQDLRRHFGNNVGRGPGKRRALLVFMAIHQIAVIQVGSFNPDTNNFCCEYHVIETIGCSVMFDTGETAMTGYRVVCNTLESLQDALYLYWQNKVRDLTPSQNRRMNVTFLWSHGIDKEERLSCTLPDRSKYGPILQGNSQPPQELNCRLRSNPKLTKASGKEKGNIFGQPRPISTDTSSCSSLTSTGLPLENSIEDGRSKSLSTGKGDNDPTHSYSSIHHSQEDDNESDLSYNSRHIRSQGAARKFGQGVGKLIKPAKDTDKQICKSQTMSGSLRRKMESRAVKAGRNEAKKWGSQRRAASHKRFYGLDQNQTTLSPFVTITKRAKGPGCSNSSPLDLTRNCTNGAHSGIVDQPQPNFADIAKRLFVDTKEMDDNTSLAYPDDELSEEEERAVTDWSNRIKVWENMTKEETESVQQLIRLCDDRKKEEERRDSILHRRKRSGRRRTPNDENRDPASLSTVLGSMGEKEKSILQGSGGTVLGHSTLRTIAAATSATVISGNHMDPKLLDRFVSLLNKKFAVGHSAKADAAGRKAGVHIAPAEFIKDLIAKGSGKLGPKKFSMTLFALECPGSDFGKFELGDNKSLCNRYIFFPFFDYQGFWIGIVCDLQQRIISAIEPLGFGQLPLKLEYVENVMIALALVLTNREKKDYPHTNPKPFSYNPISQKLEENDRRGKVNTGIFLCGVAWALASGVPPKLLSHVSSAFDLDKIGYLVILSIVRNKLHEGIEDVSALRAQRRYKGSRDDDNDEEESEQPEFHSTPPRAHGPTCLPAPPQTRSRARSLKGKLSARSSNSQVKFRKDLDTKRAKSATHAQSRYKGSHDDDQDDESEEQEFQSTPPHARPRRSASVLTPHQTRSGGRSSQNTFSAGSSKSQVPFKKAPITAAPKSDVHAQTRYSGRQDDKEEKEIDSPSPSASSDGSSSVPARPRARARARMSIISTPDSATNLSQNHLPGESSSQTTRLEHLMDQLEHARNNQDQSLYERLHGQSFALRLVMIGEKEYFNIHKKQNTDNGDKYEYVMDGKFQACSSEEPNLITCRVSSSLMEPFFGMKPGELRKLKRNNKASANELTKSGGRNLMDWMKQERCYRAKLELTSHEFFTNRPELNGRQAILYLAEELQSR